LSIPLRVRGVKILKAVSSSVRLQILNLLFDKGPLSYTELISSLKMNPTRDAGKFAYHLKFLLRTDLIEANVETKKYCLTELGKTVIDVADKIEKKAFKPKRILVRTSHYALEEFDANKIAAALTKEANMPAELAQKVAKEAERELLKSKTKYLTTPLVREVVDAILIEKGLEEYRHKLTRLGLPVHDVAALIESHSKASHGQASIHEIAGKTVLKEYALLNVLPRDIADAHLSGSLHINDLDSWILKPTEIMHDIRFFFRNSAKPEETLASQCDFSQPQNLESALSIIRNILLYASRETTRAQAIDYFNVFLAPFAKGMDPAKVKDALRAFVCTLNRQTNVSLSLELRIPDFVAKKQAFGPFGESVGKYEDFLDESQALTLLVLEIFAEETTHVPFFNPAVIVKMRQGVFENERERTLLLTAHKLASEKGIPFFANLGNEEKHSVFSSSGLKLGGDDNGDWEVETLRAGCLGCVSVNLPQISYESDRDKPRFFGLLTERLEMANRALEIKYSALKQRGRGLIPFLMKTFNGDQYLELGNCTLMINLVGLKEAAEAFCQKSIYEDEKTFGFAEEISQYASDYTRRHGKRRGRRLASSALPDFEASRRFVRLDIERFGVAKTRFSGTRERPFYSSLGALQMKEDKAPSEYLVEQKLSKYYPGGVLQVFELDERDFEPEKLLSLTQQIVQGQNVFFTYSRRLTYCGSCRKNWFGVLKKCPSCGAVGTLRVYDRFAQMRPV
jgi:ribonucleoside-triphosphate reductase